MTYAAAYASAAPVPQGFGRVTVTITPTILVSTNSEGDPVTVGSEEADSNKPDFGKPDLDKPDGEEPDHGGPERRIQR